MDWATIAFFIFIGWIWNKDKEEDRKELVDQIERRMKGIDQKKEEKENKIVKNEYEADPRFLGLL